VGEYNQEQCIQNSSHEKHGQTNTPPVAEQEKKIDDSLIFRATTGEDLVVRNPRELVHNFMPLAVPCRHTNKA